MLNRRDAQFLPSRAQTHEVVEYTAAARAYIASDPYLQIGVAADYCTGKRHRICMLGGVSDSIMVHPTHLHSLSVKATTAANRRHRLAIWSVATSYRLPNRICDLPQHIPRDIRQYCYARS